MPSPPEPEDSPPAPRRPGPPPRPVLPSHAVDYAAAQEAERLLTRATIQFRRGLTADAETAVRELLAQRPQDAGAQELLSDIRLTRGDLPGSREALQAALTAEPGRPTAEIKLAKLALQIAERERLAQGGLPMAAATATARHSGGAWAGIASAFLPGLGQFMNGETLKAIVVASIYVVCLLLLSVLPDTRTLLRQVALPTHNESVSGTTWFLLFCCRRTGCTPRSMPPAPPAAAPFRRIKTAGRYNTPSP